MDQTTVEGLPKGVKIIQIRVKDNEVRKRALHDNDDLKRWLDSLGKYDCVWDDNDVEWDNLSYLSDNMVYHLKGKKRRTDEGGGEELFAESNKDEKKHAPLRMVAPAPATPTNPSAADKPPLSSSEVQVYHNLTLNRGSLQLLREDWNTALPTRFQIGAVSEFGETALPEDLFANFSQFVVENKSDGNRRALGSVVAMPGWGKTVFMDLLAQLTAVCRRNLAPQSSEERLAEMWNSVVNKLPRERKEKLASCVPLAITLNTTMSLELNNNEDAEKMKKIYDQEIAKRLMFAYFGNLDLPFDLWVSYQETGKWTCSLVLMCLKHWAQKATRMREDDDAEDEEDNKMTSPLLLLLIDEPDHKGGASSVLSALSTTALVKGFDVDCRVVMTSLEQKWLFRECTDSGRPITDLRVALPHDDILKKLLINGLTKKADDGVHLDDLNDVANYVLAVAGEHWRTLTTAYTSIRGSNQLSSASMKEYVGRAEAYVPNAWKRNTEATAGQLEEALAHSILGSKLFWMEPLEKGTAWQAIATGVIRMYLGTSEHVSFAPVVPLLVVLRLSEDTLSNEALRIHWKGQLNGARRSKLLVETLALARFFPSRTVSSATAGHELYENLASHFMLLKWDARARIDAAVRRRWGLIDASDDRAIETLLTIPGGVSKYYERDEAKRDANYNCVKVAEWRNASNEAWSKSRGLDRTPNAPTERPYLWLVPPNATAINEFDLRLHVFRGATCCTKFRSPNGIQVLPPDPSTADIYKCDKKLFTNNAAVRSNMVLSAGSGIEPAKGNDGFDSLFVLRKRDTTWMFALIENKYEKNKINMKTLTKKLELLKKYRGKLWESPKEMKAPNAAKLCLPKIKESDIVWVLLADSGWVDDIPQEVENWLKENPDEFLGHVLLTTSEIFFGASFGKVNLLQRLLTLQYTVTTGQSSSCVQRGL